MFNVLRSMARQLLSRQARYNSLDLMVTLKYIFDGLVNCNRKKRVGCKNVQSKCT